MILIFKLIKIKECVVTYKQKYVVSMENYLVCYYTASTSGSATFITHDSPIGYGAASSGWPSDARAIEISHGYFLRSWHSIALKHDQ